MKKFFSLIAAVLFAGSMMANDVTITASDFTAVTESDYSTTKDGVTVAVKASTVTADQMRIFKGKTITISSESVITKIEFTCTANGTAKYGPGCFAAQTGYTYEASGKKGTWEGSATSVSFTAESNQVRATQIVVTYDDGGSAEPKQEYYLVGSVIGWEANATYKLKANSAQAGEYMIEYTAIAGEGLKVLGVKGEDKTWYKDGTGNEYIVSEAGDYTIYFRPEGNNDWGYTYFELVKIEPLADPTNCAEAREAALSVSANNELYNGGAEYTITGYVTAIATAWNSTFKNISFWMADTKEGGQVLQAYRAACESEADAPNLGDKVAVTGKLTKYNSTPEFAAACTYTILERAEVVDPVNLGEKTIAEFLELKNVKDTCVITGVVYNIYNAEYGNLYLVDGTDTLNVYGVLTPQGESKKFAELNVAEGDTLTVKAVYALYNNKPQAKNTVFVSVAKKVVVPTGDTINVSITSNLMYVDYVESEGWWQIYGGNEQYYISISNVETTQAEGTYTISDLDGDYTYLGVINGADTTWVTFSSGSVTLSIDATTGNVTIAGVLGGEDGNAYNFNLLFAIPKAETTVYVNITDGAIEDSIEEYNDITLYGTDANDVYVQLDFYPVTQIVGSYTEADLYPEYSAVFEGEDGYAIYSLTATITAGNGNGDYNVVADILCYNNTLYKVTMYIPAEEPTGIEETLAAGKAAKVLRNGQLLIMKGDKTFNMTGARIR